MENKKKALGKGLEQLFSNERIDFNSFEQKIYDEVKEDEVVSLSLAEIRPNPYQPRKNFDEETLKELCESIKEHGVVQPIIVKKSIKGYELIAGERRTKASKMAGLDKIPAIIRNFNDQEMMEIALVENIQRENLNPIEEAESFMLILKRNHLTQDELAKKFGKSRSYITNILGLLRLPEKTKKEVINKNLSMAHAKILSKLEDEEKILELTNKIIKSGISVHSLEELVNEENFVKKVKIKKSVPVNPLFKEYENLISDKIGSKVKLKHNKIEINYSNSDDLERILSILDIKCE